MILENYTPEYKNFVVTIDKNRIHDIKTWPKYFGDLIEGNKTFELRKDDRDYKVGDYLRCNEWNDLQEEYTGTSILYRIMYVCRDVPQWGLSPGFCILGIKQVMI